MTLADLIPSLAGMLPSRPYPARQYPARLEPGMWPEGTRLTESGELLLDDVDLAELAACFGTPLCVLAEAEVRRRWRSYHAALNVACDRGSPGELSGCQAVPGQTPLVTEIAYQGSAISSPEVLRWLDQERMSLVLCSASQLQAARVERFPAARIVLHASGQAPADLKAALAYQVSRIVIAAPQEANLVAALAERPQPILLSIAQGSDDIAQDGSVMGGMRSLTTHMEAVRQVLAAPTLQLAGLHCFLGVRIRRTGIFELAVRRMLGVVAAIRDAHGICPRCLYLGGSHAAPLPGGGLDIAQLARRLRIEMHYECMRLRLPLPLPRLVVEPGPALMSRVGVILSRADSAGAGPSADACSGSSIQTPAGMALAGDASSGGLVAMSYPGADEEPLAAGADAHRRPAIVAITDGMARLLAPAGTGQIHPSNRFDRPERQTQPLADLEMQ